MLEINGTKLELDIFDVETHELLERAFRAVQIGVADAQQKATTTEQIRYQCEVVYDFFDEVFGEGVADEVFEGKMNLLKCLDAFAKVIEYTTEQKKQLTELTDKYTTIAPSPIKTNRAQRRANQR